METKTMRETLVKEAKATDKYEELCRQVDLVTELLGDAGADQDELTDAIEKGKSKAEAVNKAMRESLVAKLVATDAPVKGAIELGYVDIFNFRTVSAKRNKDTGLVTDPAKAELDTKMEIIDLSIMNTATDKRGELFTKSDAMAWLNGLNHCIYAEKVRVGGITKVSDKLSQWAANAVEEKYAVKFDSKAGKAKTMQIVFDKLLFEETETKKGEKVNAYKWDKRYADILFENYTRWSNSKINSLVFPKEATFRQMFMRVAHLLVTGEELEAE